eukprot:IDg11503t1
MDDSDEEAAVIDFHMRRSREEESKALAEAGRLRCWSRADQRPNKIRNFEEGLGQMMRDDLNEYCVYEKFSFQRIFIMPQTVLKRIYDKISARPFFVRKVDALCTPGTHPLQRITASLRMMTYKVAHTPLMSTSGSAMFAMESMKGFAKGVVEEWELSICAVLRPQIC